MQRSRVTWNRVGNKRKVFPTKVNRPRLRGDGNVPGSLVPSAGNVYRPRKRCVQREGVGAVGELTAVLFPEKGT